MQIKDMFRKKIDREIQGVIIVGQGEETNVAQELEEYVVTRELQRHFADFFAAYKKGIQGTTPKWGGELRKHFSKERCSQTAMPFFAVFPLYFGLFLSPVQNQMHR